MKWHLSGMMIIFMVNVTLSQVTVYPQGLSERILQVHDSISPFAELKLTHGLNTGQGLKMRLYSTGHADIHNRLGDLILKSGATGPGAHMVLEEFGNIAIGYPRFSATHALHIKDTDPLRLQGLTHNLSYDTLLVVSPSGVLHKRAQNTFPASYWTKSGNFVFNTTDSIGIGVSSPNERLFVKDAMKVGSSSDIARLKLESVFINSEFGQYKFGTSDLLLDGVLPASGLTYINAKQGSSDVVSSQGLLLNVEGPQPMIFATNDKEAMRIDKNAWLAIGAQNAFEPLHVDSSMYVGDVIRLARSSLQVGQYKQTSPNLNDVHIYAPNYIQFASAVRTQMVDPRGATKAYATFDNFTHRLGIDTILPAHSLHVNGETRIEDSLFISEIVFGPQDKNIIRSTASGLKIENNHTYSDSRSNIVINNAYGHFMTMEENQINFVSGARNYLKFDGLNRSMSINGFTTTPRETLDVVGSAIIEDTIRISGFDKLISGQNGDLEITSDEPINITADLSNVSISDGIFPYAIFEGSTRNFGLLNSGPVRRKLEVGGSGIIQDSLFIRTLGNSISATSSGQIKVDSESDIILKPEENELVRIEHSGSGEALDVRGTIETDRIKITDGAIPGRVLISDGDGLGFWSVIPPDGDWNVVGVDLQVGVPGNVTIGAGIAQNSKWNVNGSVAKPIKVVSGSIYNLLSSDYTVVLADPTPVIANLPLAADCPGRIYKIKFLTPGGSIVPAGADLIDLAGGSFTVPTPVGAVATTIMIQSDGGMGWWIIN